MAKHKLGDNEQLQGIINDSKRFDTAEERELFKKGIKSPLWMDKRKKCRTKYQGVIYGECKQIKPLLDNRQATVLSKFTAKHQSILKIEIENRQKPHLKRINTINSQVSKSKWWEYATREINKTLLQDKRLQQKPFDYFLDFISAGRLKGVTLDLNENEAKEFFIGCCEVLRK